VKAWYADVSPNRHRLFAGRQYGQVLLDDDHVVVRTRRHRTVLASPVDLLTLVRVRNGFLLQVLARDTSDHTHVFEFRPRRHGEGRALADALR
jgi:hypothetical protein